MLLKGTEVQPPPWEENQTSFLNEAEFQQDSVIKLLALAARIFAAK